jgi:S1-C subfamily serine protease
MDHEPEFDRDPSPPPIVIETRQRSGPSVPLVLATSIVAALIASFGTAALVVPREPAATTAADASPEPVAQSAVHVVGAPDAVVDVAARVSPAVVTITNSSAGSFGPFSVPTTGVGSGFVFRADGLILTNWHVVVGADTVSVAFNDGSLSTGRVVGSDQQLDLAIVRVDASGLPVAPLGTSAGLRPGQLVVAIGSPLGTFTDSVTSGILSATGRSLQVGGRGQPRERLTNLLQTDAAINEGNSGGPLLDVGGQVIGINVAVATSAQGIGFAVPIDAAADLIARAGT